jgi:hypothetical protein
VTSEAQPLRAARAPGLDTYWPAGEHRTLLEIACKNEHAARLAWARWVAASGGREPDLGSLRLLPLVAQRLRELRVSNASGPRLQGVYRHAWCTNQIMVSQALSLVDALHRNGIEAMALKGLALLPGAYGGDPGLRAMFDVDLLVRRTDLARAANALEAEGFRAKFRAFLPGQGQAPVEGHAVVFRKGKLEVDLHWCFLQFDSSPWLEAEVWSRARRATLCGRELVVPSPSDLMLLVCTHGLTWTHGAVPLWPADVWRLAQHFGETDWQRLIELARSRLFTLLVYSALRFVREALEGAIPDSVLTALARSEVSPAEVSELKSLTIPRYSANATDRLVAGRLAHMRSKTPASLRPRFFATGGSESSAMEMEA